MLPSAKDASSAARAKGALSVSRRRTGLAFPVAALAMVMFSASTFAGDAGGGSNIPKKSTPRAGTEPIKIAVFGFELEDFSAAGTTVPGPNEGKYLSQATDTARRALAASGRYSIVSTDGADLAAAQGHGLRNCRGCDAPIAAALGADQDMIGVVTRISQTKYTVTVQVSDARKGTAIKTFTTGLRIGAGYSWARGTEWLMKKRVLASPERP